MAQDEKPVPGIGSRPLGVEIAKKSRRRGSGDPSSKDAREGCKGLERPCRGSSSGAGHQSGRGCTDGGRGGKDSR
eukprot:1136431-Pyramimonas_sp.AAC.1